jgi:hypothetical protein
MRSARLIVAILTPVLVVACAVGTAPEGSGGEVEGDDGGASTTNDSGYGTTGDSGPVSAQDSGSKADGGATPIDGGATPIDSGTPITTSGADCSGKNSSGGESYESECKDLYNNGEESDCTVGGGECGAGTCCYDNSGSFSFGSCDGVFGDFLGPQCVAQ